MKSERLPNDLTVRRTVASDIPALIKLRWDVCVEQGVADPSDAANHRAYEQALRAFLERHIAEDACQFWVAEGGGEIITTSTLWLAPVLPWPGGLNQWYGYVTNVYTVPGYRRQGLARRLMEKLREVAANHGATELLLETTPEAAPLYEQLGFRQIEILALKISPTERL